mmetsp:Transcript_26970/g.56668  ORF Transcript_26970/g.56668 Transcript_26970/m.56668 type:complete len:224 (+) Transcript_26970:291-962(+)
MSLGASGFGEADAPSPPRPPHSLSWGGRCERSVTGRSRLTPWPATLGMAESVPVAAGLADAGVGVVAASVAPSVASSGGQSAGAAAGSALGDGVGAAASGCMASSSSSAVTSAALLSSLTRCGAVSRPAEPPSVRRFSSSSICLSFLRSCRAREAALSGVWPVGLPKGNTDTPARAVAAAASSAAASSRKIAARRLALALACSSSAQRGRSVSRSSWSRFCGR